MKKTLLVTLVALPLLAAPALAVTMTPSIKPPAPTTCDSPTITDCATIHQVGRIKRA